MIGKLPSKTEKASDPFAFTDAFKTGIQSVDDQHQRLFDIIRETNDLIHEELLHDKYDEIMRLLTQLREYTEFHFHDEEALMNVFTIRNWKLKSVRIRHLWNVW